MEIRRSIEGCVVDWEHQLQIHPDGRVFDFNGVQLQVAQGYGAPDEPVPTVRVPRRRKPVNGADNGNS